MLQHVRNTALIFCSINVLLHPTILVPICTAVAGIATLRYAIACNKVQRIAHKQQQRIAYVAKIVHKS